MSREDSKETCSQREGMKGLLRELCATRSSSVPALSFAFRQVVPRKRNYIVGLRASGHAIEHSGRQLGASCPKLL